MRPREEQITELTEILYEAGYRFQNKAKPEAERIILEAERRAEQRVRAEIARDSERLDWLEKLPLADIYRDGHGREIGINRVSFSEGKQTLRETIDASREVW